MRKKLKLVSLHCQFYTHFFYDMQIFYRISFLLIILVLVYSSLHKTLESRNDINFSAKFQFPHPIEFVTIRRFYDFIGFHYSNCFSESFSMTSKFNIYNFNHFSNT